MLLSVAQVGFHGTNYRISCVMSPQWQSILPFCFLAAAVWIGNRQDLHLLFPGGNLEAHALAESGVEQRLGKRREPTDAATLRVPLRDAHDVIERFFSVAVSHRDCGP